MIDDSQGPEVKSILLGPTGRRPPFADLDAFNRSMTDKVEALRKVACKLSAELGLTPALGTMALRAAADDLCPPESVGPTSAPDAPMLAALPDGTSIDTRRALQAIAVERLRQDQCAGGKPREDNPKMSEVNEAIIERLIIVNNDHRDGKYRSALVEIAALAVVRIESYDRSC